MEPTPAKTCWSLERDLYQVQSVAIPVKTYAMQFLNDDDAAAVELALVEAVTNAIKHGSINGRDTGQITVTAQVFDDRFVVEVVDHVPVLPQAALDRARNRGAAFNIDNVAALDESGRGVSLMVLVMDEIILSTANDKYVLSMVKYIS
ncbi:MULTISPECIES: ATP-binding protein [unclassified Yoonia]|uniref:ATP-binding protein n=1 Tax=unclassified Yoonia TaxID=2629118 RepID=UPI002AFF0FDC|nr:MULTISPECIES: ATP-binding protein [unclassified Yoonia]